MNNLGVWLVRGRRMLVMTIADGIDRRIVSHFRYGGVVSDLYYCRCYLCMNERRKCALYLKLLCRDICSLLLFECEDAVEGMGEQEVWRYFHLCWGRVTNTK